MQPVQESAYQSKGQARNAMKYAKTTTLNGLEFMLRESDGIWWPEIYAISVNPRIEVLNSWTSPLRMTVAEAKKQFKNIVKNMEPITENFVPNWTIEQLKTVRELYRVFDYNTRTNLDDLISQKEKQC